MKWHHHQRLWQRSRHRSVGSISGGGKAAWRVIDEISAALSAGGSGRRVAALMAL
jgi:hypothetical protein